MTEIITFEQQWLVEPFDQGVGKAVAEIECGTMPALAKLRESRAGHFGLAAINADDLNLGCIQKMIQIGLRFGAVAGADHNR